MRSVNPCLLNGGFLFLLITKLCLQVPETYTPPAPITAPIMAPLGEPHPVATMQPSLQPQQLPPQPAGVAAPFNPMQQQPLPPAVRNPAIPSMPVEGAPGAPTGDVIQVSKKRHALKCSLKLEVIKLYIWNILPYFSVVPACSDSICPNRVI